MFFLHTAVVCGTPADGSNTVPVPPEVDMAFGDEYVYSCLAGYEPAVLGMNFVTECLADSTFSLIPPPSCISKWLYNICLVIIFLSLKKRAAIVRQVKIDIW